MADLAVTGTIIASKAVDDYIALTARPNDGNKTTRLQVLGDGNVVHTAIVAKQVTPTGAGAPTDSRLELQTMDGGTLATRLTIDENAKVLVGTVAAIRKVNVQGGIYLNSAESEFEAIMMRPNDGANSTKILAQGDNAVPHSGIVFKQVLPTGSGNPTDSQLELQTMDAGTLATRFIINQDGRVGIGNTSPAALLHVGAGVDAPTSANVAAHFTNAGATALSVRDSANDVEAVIRAESGVVTMGAASFHPLRLKAQTIDVMHISVLGVGIGNTAPGAGLDVSGRIRSRGLSSNATYTAPLNLAVKSAGSGTDTAAPGISFHKNDGDRTGAIQASPTEMDFYGGTPATAPGVVSDDNYREARIKNRWFGVGGWERPNRAEDGIVNFCHWDWKGRWIFGVTEGIEDVAVTMIQPTNLTFRIWAGTIILMSQDRLYEKGQHISVLRGDHTDVDLSGDGTEIVRFDITTDINNYMRVYRTAGVKIYRVIYAGIYV
jgi:hypothetical protein